MKLKLFSLLLAITLLASCKQEKQQLVKIEGVLIPISDSLKTNPEIEDYIKPYREHLNKELDSVLSYSKETYTKKDGDLNTAIGNLFADAILEQTNPIFNKRTGKNIDLVMFNHGGIRSHISKGNITTRTAYEIMPFENKVVVISLKGSQVNKLVEYLVSRHRAHPISGLKLVLDKEGGLKEASMHGEPIEDAKTYYVATNDYLYNGGDGMDFFKPNDTVYSMDYKIRNVLLDYFIKTDTIAPVVDDRFIQLEN
ncbi:5'-nucleotidase C-terminal domain-containing protein [Mangrovimonas sp. ST2L15]|uniref:5'-nucleotidase C-terminal domain-containing protein n=1 Tax=Mangrovimonas sp. ST2L15 TaxID=1645916 RepID=UPI0006B5FF29|nr:5'-nucleotidase [Mangrovimonas sp. ST2L15]